MKIKSIAVICGIFILTGCVAYAPPYPQYGAPMSSPYRMQSVYGGYGYGVAPVVPVPVLGFGGWGYGRFRGYGGFRR